MSTTYSLRPAILADGGTPRAWQLELRERRGEPAPVLESERVVAAQPEAYAAAFAEGNTLLSEPPPSACNTARCRGG